MKSHQVFMSASRPWDAFICAREQGNHRSTDVILVKLRDGSTVGHVPDALARVLAPMLDVGQLMHMKGTITRSAPEGVWVPGGGIEIPCKYLLHGAGKDCDHVRQFLPDAQKSRKRKAKDWSWLCDCLLCACMPITLLHYYNIHFILPHE